MMLFSSFGYEYRLQAPLVAAFVPVPWKWPGGQTTGVAARFAVKTALFCIATTPATCACDDVPQFAVQGGPGWLATGAPSVLKSTPDEAVLALNEIDRKSTRLNSSHTVISYAVFCLKKKIMLIA